MKLWPVVLLMGFGQIAGATAAVVFLDDFNRCGSNCTIVGNNWVEVNTGLGDAAILTNQLVLKNGPTVGQTWVSQSVGNFSNPYQATLAQNADQITWSFNIRSSRGGFNSLTGFDPGQYGIAFLLAGSSTNFLSGTGYAVVWGQTGGGTPLRLVQFSAGLGGNASLSNLIVAIASPFNSVGTDYLSVRVIYDPAGDAWQLFGRDDGTTTFADPTTGTLTLLGSATNNNYTAQPLGYMGALWNYNTTLNQYAFYDNFSVDAAQRPPTITVQPQNQLAVLNQNASLNVTAVGARPLSYQWYFNSSLMGGQTNATLTIPSFQFTNAGSYTVAVTNAFGSAISTAAVLTVARSYGEAPDPPYPTLLANNGARHIIVPGIYIGSCVSAKSDGNPNPTATGDPCDNGVNLTSQLVPGQTATAQVIASTNGYLNAWMDFNQNGSWANSGEQIFVNQPLSPGVNNLSFPVTATAVSGASAVARFRFNSAGGLSYTGDASDGEVEDYRFAINTAGDLAVSVSGAPNPVAVGSNLIYLVTVTNQGPSQASGVTVTDVLPAGVSFVSVTSSQGGCTQSANTVSCNLGMLLPGFQATLTIVTVPNVAATITNAVSVTANEPDSNPANNTASTTTVVKSVVAITSQPQSLTVTNGTSATFNLSATSTGTLSYQWRFGGTNLAGQTASTLTLANVQAANAGTYDVVVADTISSTVSAPATLTVLVKPSITNQPQSQTGPLGGYVTFNVGATGTLPLGYQWYFNTTNAIGGATSSILTLNNLQTNNAGNYTVLVTNVAGAVTSTGAVLTVKAMNFGTAPDPPYPTLLANNGAHHIIVPGVYLGRGVSTNADGNPTASPKGDNDGGVTFTNRMLSGQTETVKVVASTSGYLNAWMDFSQVGSWAQGTDQIFADQAVLAGTNTVTFEVPYYAVAGPTFGRFRFSTTNGLSYVGIAPDGEVDDYVVTNNPATVTQLVIATEPPAFATAGAVFNPSPVVYVADNRGNPVFSDSSTTVTATRVAGAGTLQGTLTAVAQNGVATFTNLYHLVATNVTIKFTASSMAVTSSVVEVDPALPSQLVIQRQPSSTATAGSPFATQPIVQIQDVFGNLIDTDNGRPVTASRNLGSGTLQGNSTVATTNGVVTYSGLYHAVANTINLEFDSAGLTSANSSNIVVNPASASQLVFASQPGNAAAGAPFGSQPVVKTQDQYGNNSTVGLTSSKIVAVTLTSGGGPLQGTTNLDIGTSAGNGMVSYANLRVDNAGANKQLTAGASSLSSGVSSNFSVGAGPFTKLQLLVPGETAAPGTAPGKTGSPIVQVTDGPFSITINAVDAFWNIVNATDTVGITSSDTSAILPPNTALIAGTQALLFTFNTAGSQMITARDVTDSTKITNTSPSITVNAAPYMPATGGNAISADATGGAYTNLTGPIYQEATAGNVGTGIVVLVCASGFVFDTNVPPPSVKLEGATGGSKSLINGAANGSTQAVSSVTTGQIVFTVTSISANTTTKLTWQNLRVRPSAGTPLARGNIAKSGTATMVGVTANSNFGTLREIAGAAQRIAIQVQPSPAATAGVGFAQQPLVGIADQFGNLRNNANGNSDNSTTVNAARAAGSGTLQGSLTATAADGLAAYSNLYHQVASTITLNFTSGALSNAVSTPIIVSPAQADRLVFTQQPGATVAGMVFGTQPVLVSRDPFGNNSAQGLPANLPVTMTLSSGVGPLLGTTMLDIGSAAGNGVITNTDLRIDSAGTNDQLTAGANGLTNATSGIFTVSDPPSIAGVSFNPGVFSLSFTTASGLAYAVEYKNSLLDPVWLTLTNVTGTGGVMIFTDPTATGQSRFYHLHLHLP